MLSYKEIKEAADFISGKIVHKPELGMILGSGLGAMAEDVSAPVYIDYGTIPHFPVSTAPGHKGRFVIGTLEGKTVMIMQGRFHFYEGYDMTLLSLPVRVMKLIGIPAVIITNAAGGVNFDFKPGDLMLITDHLKPWGQHPLNGPHIPEFGVRFPDMSKAYTPALREKALAVGKNLGIPLHQGVYTWFSGPSYETPAEIRMVRTLGGDAVGMSTVPEVIAAASCGLQVLGISCITNMAAGVLDQPITEDEVLETGKLVRDKFTRLIKGIIAG